jgi:hypothetical protein
VIVGVYASRDIKRELIREIWKEGKRLAEIARPEAPLDAVSFLRQLAVWGRRVEELSLLAREWRYSPATGGTGLPARASVILLNLRLHSPRRRCAHPPQRGDRMTGFLLELER